MINLLIADDNYEFVKCVFNKIIDIKYINVMNISSNGKEALEFMLNKEVDIVVLDLQMPILNGIEILNKLNKSQNGYKMPRIIVTTGDRLLLSEGLKNNLPIEYVFEKPFDLNELVLRIEDICKDILNENISVKDDVIEILKNLEFNTSALGYSYLIDCITVCIENKHKTIFKIKEVYSSIKNINDNYVSDQNVKWNIDKAIKSMVNHTSKKQ
jgi:response regulator RpfG family c-di-GMP phosphodiesterase